MPSSLLGGVPPPVSYPQLTSPPPTLLPAAGAFEGYTRDMGKRIGKPRKKDEKPVEVPPEPVKAVEAEIEPIDLYLPEKPLVPEESVFDDNAAMIDTTATVSVFPEEEQPVAVLPVAQPVAQSLESVDEAAAARKELAKLLNTAIPLKQRVKLLVKLAHHTDTKRAPVALRAIQEINTLTGVTADGANEAAPMFLLPPDTSVSVHVEKVIK